MNGSPTLPDAPCSTPHRPPTKTLRTFIASIFGSREREANPKMSKTIGAAEFKATCLRVIKQINRDGESVVVTRHGRPVAVVSPAPADAESPFLVGAMRGSVLGYDDPFEPAADPADWTALR